MEARPRGAPACYAATRPPPRPGPAPAPLAPASPAPGSRGGSVVGRRPQTRRASTGRARPLSRGRGAARAGRRVRAGRLGRGLGGPRRTSAAAAASNYAPREGPARLLGRTLVEAFESVSRELHLRRPLRPAHQGCQGRSRGPLRPAPGGAPGPRALGEGPERPTYASARPTYLTQARGPSPSPRPGTAAAAAGTTGTTTRTGGGGGTAATPTLAGGPSARMGRPGRGSGRPGRHGCATRGERAGPAAPSTTCTRRYPPTVLQPRRARAPRATATFRRTTGRHGAAATRRRTPARAWKGRRLGHGPRRLGHGPRRPARRRGRGRRRAGAS